MIISGIREKEHKGSPVNTVLCRNCGHDKHVSFAVSRYFHMFWIPFMITSRQVGLRCSNCKKVSTNNKIPHDVEMRLRKTLFTPFRVLPLYSGLLLVALFVALLYFAHLENEKDERALLQAPKIHDVYLADLSLVFPKQQFGEFNFGAMRILSVTDEGVLLAVSKDSFSDSLALSKLITRDIASSEDFYGGKTIFLSNEDVINLHEAEAIRSITRVFHPVNNSKPIKW